MTVVIISHIPPPPESTNIFTTFTHIRSAKNSTHPNDLGGGPALNEAQYAKDITRKLEAQQQVIKSQAKQIEKAEAYSKRYNLKGFLTL